MLAARGLTDGHGEGPALFEALDLEVPASSVLGVIGRSGCGKSTLLDALAGLRRPRRGRVTLAGRDITGAPGHCSLMPQRSLLLPWRDLVGNASLALEVAGVPKREARARVLPHLEAFGLEGCERLAPHALSGGMQRRVGLLRAWLHGSPVLLLDEPFGALDAITRAELHGWFADLVARVGLAAVLVTHDIDEALTLSNRLLVFERGAAVREVAVPVDGVARAELRRRITAML